MDRPRVSLRGLRPPFRGRNVTSAMRWPRPCVLPATDGPCVALSRDGSAGEGRDGGRRGTAGLAGDGRVPPGPPPPPPFRSRLGKTESAKKRGAFPSASRPANQGEEAGLGQSPGQDQRPGIARCPGGACGWAGGGPQGADPKYYFWGAGGGGTITHSRRSRLNRDPRRPSLPSAPQRPVLPCLLLAATHFAHRRRGAHRAWLPPPWSPLAGAIPAGARGPACGRGLHGAPAHGRWRLAPRKPGLSGLAGGSTHFSGPC